MNIGAHGSFSIPIQDEAYDDEVARLSFVHVKLPDFIYYRGCQVLTDSKHLYSDTYMTYNKASKMLMANYSKDITKCKFTSNLVCIKEGHELDHIFMYGKTDKYATSFTPEMMSYDKEMLIREITKKPIWIYLITGAVLTGFGLYIYSKNE